MSSFIRLWSFDLSYDVVLPQAGDTTTTLNEYIHEKQGMNKSVSNGVHQPSAMDKNLNTDCTDDTDLTFSLIFSGG